MSRSSRTACPTPIMSAGPARNASRPAQPQAAAAAPRVRAYSRAQAATKRSTSAAVLAQPRLTRIARLRLLGRDAHGGQHVRGADLAGRAGGAGADRDAGEVERRSAGSGWRRPAWSGRRCWPGAARRRPARAPRARSPAICASSRSRSAPTRAGQSRSAAASSQARPKPTMPGRFSVPGRQRRSCAPPPSSASGSTPGPEHQRADALRAAELVRRQRHQVDARDALTSIGILPAAWTASQCTSAPCRRAAATTSRDRLEDAGLVVGEHHRDQRRPDRLEQLGQPSRSITPCRSTGIRSASGAAARTESCSIAETSLAPLTLCNAWLFASVPPLVNTTASGGAPTSAATDSRASLEQPAGARPARWTEEGLPVLAERRGHRRGDLGPHRRRRIVVEIAQNRRGSAPGHDRFVAHFCAVRRKSAPALRQDARRPSTGRRSAWRSAPAPQPGAQLLDLPASRSRARRDRIDRRRRARCHRPGSRAPSAAPAARSAGPGCRPPWRRPARP